MSHAVNKKFNEKLPACDSYFVEDADHTDNVHARAMLKNEQKKAFDRTRQRQLAQEISEVTADEYEEDILQHMEQMELLTLPDVNSIEVQTEIQWFMRPYLLDFLLEAHQAFQLLPETLFLTINLLDRYCSRRVVYKRHYQLVGCAALLIAAKYGDRKERVPTIRELKSMCCSLYDEDMFTQMEWHVLQTLNWVVGHPTVASFLELALYESPQEPVVEHMALYISELAMYHKKLISVRPSVMAKSSIALAKCVLGRTQSRDGEWGALYDPGVVLDLSNHLGQPSQALYRKYASQSLSSAASIVDQFLQNQALVAHHAADCSAAAHHVQQQHQHQAMAPQMVSNDAYMHPQTPQKGAYHVTSNGVLTPPITPDGLGPDMCSIRGTAWTTSTAPPNTNGRNMQAAHVHHAFSAFA